MTGQRELQGHVKKVSMCRAEACTAAKQDLIKTVRLCLFQYGRRLTVVALQELCFNTADPMLPSAQIHSGATPFKSDNSKQNQTWF